MPTEARHHLSPARHRAALVLAGLALTLAAAGCAQTTAPAATPNPAPAASPTTTTDPSALLPNGAKALSEARADFDGDGKVEVAILAAFGYQADRLSAEHLELFIVAPSADGYTQAWRSGTLLGERAEQLQAADVNKDGRPEIVSKQSLGAAGETLYLFGALGGKGYGILAPKGGAFDGRPSFGEVSARLEDLDGDGTQEVLAGYGPAASRTDVYRWNGQTYAFLFTHQDPDAGPLPVARVAGTVASVDAARGTARITTATGTATNLHLQAYARFTTAGGAPTTLASLAPGAKVEAFGGRAADGTLLAEALIVTEGKMESTQPAGLNLSLVADESEYQVGDTVQLTFTVANPGQAPLKLDFSSGQQFDLAIADATGQEVWRWSRGKLFIQAFTKVEIQPGQKKTYEADWQAEGPPGRYQAKGWLTSPGATAQATATFNIR
ncbi:MAG: BsuPI-related putative proteinase inhibitor [Chloroflexota bacterium]